MAKDHLEKQIEKKLIELVREVGGISRKFVSPGQRGVPDRIVIWPGGYVHFVELKTVSGKLTKLQKSEIKRLRSSGCKVFVLFGMADVRRYIKYVTEEVYFPLAA